jgi:hypothetical protein
MIATPIRHTIDVPRPSAHPSGITEQWAESSALGRASVAHHRARPARRYLRLAPPSRPARRHRHQRCIALLRDRQTRRSRRIDTLAQAQPSVHLRVSIRVTRIQNEKSQSSAEMSASIMLAIKAYARWYRIDGSNAGGSRGSTLTAALNIVTCVCFIRMGANCGSRVEARRVRGRSATRRVRRRSRRRRGRRCRPSAG